MRGRLSRWVAVLGGASEKAGVQVGLSAGKKGRREDALLPVAHK